MTQKKAAWRSFFVAEKALYSFLSEASEGQYGTLPSFTQIRTKKDSMIEHPPRFVRYIAKLNEGVESDYFSLLADMERTYSLVKGEGSSRTARWPKFYRDVAQINISINTAYSSMRFHPGSDVPLKSIRQPDNVAEQDVVKMALDEDRITLNKWGLSSAVCQSGFENDQIGRLVAVYRIVAPCADLVRISGVSGSSVQLRRRSGLQYRARVRYYGASSGFRAKLGLIILDEQSDTTIILSQPQALRPHRLSEAKNLLKLPIDSEFELIVNP